MELNGTFIHSLHCSIVCSPTTTSSRQSNNMWVYFDRYGPLVQSNHNSPLLFALSPTTHRHHIQSWLPKSISKNFIQVEWWWLLWLGPVWSPLTHSRTGPAITRAFVDHHNGSSDSSAVSIKPPCRWPIESPVRERGARPPRWAHHSGIIKIEPTRDCCGTQTNQSSNHGTSKQIMDDANKQN